MSQHLGGSFGAHEGVSGQAEAQEEGRGKGPRRTDGHVEKADDPAQAQETSAGLDGRGIDAQQEPARLPGRHEDEDPDRQLQGSRGEFATDEQADHSCWKHQDAVRTQDRPVDVAPLKEGARAVGDELDHPVEG